MPKWIDFHHINDVLNVFVKEHWSRKKDLVQKKALAWFEMDGVEAFYAQLKESKTNELLED